MIRFSSVRSVCRAAAAFLLLGCGDLARVNPYDPSAPFEISLVGPSVVQVGDTVTFTAAITPEWTRAEAPEWSSRDTRILNPLGGGRYAAVAGGFTTIQVRFGPRVQALDVAVTSFAPSISGVSPERAHADTGKVSLTISGAGFHPLTSVTWDGAARPTQYVDPTRIVVELAAADIAAIGAHALVAVNAAPGGGSSQPAIFHSIPPLPRLRSLSRASATAGSAAFTLDVFGTYFGPDAVVRWNGGDRPTTFLSSGALTTSISAEDIAAGGTAAITVAQAGESSAPMPFPVLAGPPGVTSRITIGLASRAIVYDSARSRLYASVPASSTIHPRSVAIIDPVAGTLISAIPVGGDPGVMTLTDDHQYLYVALVDVGAVARVDLAAGSVDLQFGLGASEFCGAYIADDMAPLAGHSRTVVVARRAPRCGSSSTAVFDEGVMRPRVTSPGGWYGDRIAASGRPDQLYAHNQDEREMFLLSVVESGVIRAPAGALLMPTGPPTDIEYDAGYVFSSRGLVVDAVRLTRVAQIPASGVVLPDASRGRVHFFAGTTLTTFHPFVAALIGSVNVAEANGASAMARWGTDGVALRTTERIILIRSPLVGP